MPRAGTGVACAVLPSAPITVPGSITLAVIELTPELRVRSTSLIDTDGLVVRFVHAQPVKLTPSTGTADPLAPDALPPEAWALRSWAMTMPCGAIEAQPVVAALALSYAIAWLVDRLV